MKGELIVICPYKEIPDTTRYRSIEQAPSDCGFEAAPADVKWHCEAVNHTLQYTPTLMAGLH